jgi:predicted histidine transporter YuiF (NhaC family)
MDDVDDGTVIAALVSTLFSIFGLILVVYPKWLQEKPLSVTRSDFARSRRTTAKRTVDELRLARASQVMDLTFQNLMDDVDDGTVIAALVSTLFSIFGLILVVYPRRRRRP